MSELEKEEISGTTAGLTGIEVGQSTNNIQEISEEMTEVASRSRSDLITSTNRDRIRCLWCRVYDNFVQTDQT